ncbi:CPBP family intramembrane glutamic endopeptidase [Streptomyces sp. NPDC089799]|uniref:CPBP family intramembrane glutamic endopeptidase n=1 Tax=Streptomyces sp. NPDC089799 TaxID=3155066 RepID=UPI0034474DE6
MRMTSVDIKVTASFLTVAFLAAGALGAVQPMTGIPVEVIQLTQFGPALGVGLAALLWPRRVRELLTGTGTGTGGIVLGGVPGSGSGRAGRAGRAALLIATAPLVIAVSTAAYAALGGDARTAATDHPLALIAAAQLLGACGEEIGWRCLLQPVLRTRFGPLTASVTVGAVWGVWHVQVFAQHPVYAAAFLTATVSMSVVMGLALDGAPSHRLLLAGGFHTLVNLGMLLFMDEEAGTVLPMVLFGGSCLTAAALWTGPLVRRGRGRKRGRPAQTPPAPARVDTIMEDLR